MSFFYGAAATAPVFRGEIERKRGGPGMGAAAGIRPRPRPKLTPWVKDRPKRGAAERLARPRRQMHGRRSFTIGSFV